MNRSELEKMKRRLADRSAAEEQDPAWLLALAGVLFAVLVVVFQFI